MAIQETFDVGGYTLGAGRLYDRDLHLWIQPRGDAVRIGFDPLGRETSGDIVAISLAAPGTRVARGAEMGSLEAAKFVGPLLSPLTGTVTARNEAVLAAPGTLNDDDPATWLVELAPEEPGEMQDLLASQEEITAWFEAEVARFRSQGAIAE